MISSKNVTVKRDGLYYLPYNQYGYTVTSKIATPALLKLIDKYFNTIGVYPREFLSWSDKEREAYVRGLLDNEVLWGKAMGKPRMDGLMICFNTKISQIISQAKNVVQLHNIPDKRNFLKSFRIKIILRLRYR